MGSSSMTRQRSTTNGASYLARGTLGGAVADKSTSPFILQVQLISLNEIVTSLAHGAISSSL